MSTACRPIPGNSSGMRALNAGMTAVSGRRIFMRRCACPPFYCALAAGMLAVVLPCAPTYAVTSKDKMATCKFGADDQHLQGKARTAFMKKCMSNNDEPRGAAAVPTVPAARH
jgi:psiF repeat